MRGAFYVVKNVSQVAKREFCYDGHAIALTRENPLKKLKPAKNISLTIEIYFNGIALGKVELHYFYLH